MRMALLVTGFLVAGLTVPAEAARARWQGSFIVKKATGTCLDYNPVGSNGISRFEPQLAGTDNGPGSSFSFFYYGGHAAGFRLQSGVGVFTSAFKDVDNASIGFDFGSDDTNTVAVRFITQLPGTLKATTKFINIVAEIQNYDFMAGCTVEVHMSLIKRLD